MELIKKDLEALMTQKYKPEETLPICSKYCFIYDKKMLFVHESRGFYKLLSSGCGFEPIYYERCFDVLASSKNLDDIIRLYRSYVSRIINLGDLI